jgi:hypothetical protein
MSSDIELISLAELIAKIKSDLLAPVDPTDHRSPLLFVDGVEVTAQVVAKRKKGEGGKAGLSLSVLGFGADAGIDSKTTVTDELTQKVTIGLSPLLDKSDYLASLGPDERARLARTLQRGAVRGGDETTGEIARRLHGIRRNGFPYSARSARSAGIAQARGRDPVRWSSLGIDPAPVRCG